MAQTENPGGVEYRAMTGEGKLRTLHSRAFLIAQLLENMLTWMPEAGLRRPGSPGRSGVQIGARSTAETFSAYNRV
jgi:hypothetical protein